MRALTLLEFCMLHFHKLIKSYVSYDQRKADPVCYISYTLCRVQVDFVIHDHTSKEQYNWSYVFKHTHADNIYPQNSCSWLRNLLPKIGINTMCEQLWFSIQFWAYNSKSTSCTYNQIQNNELSVCSGNINNHKH